MRLNEDVRNFLRKSAQQILQLCPVSANERIHLPNAVWKLLIDKNMKKSDLRKIAGVSSSSLAKLSKGENVTTDVILKICDTLDCNVQDIMEAVKSESSESNE